MNNKFLADVRSMSNYYPYGMQIEAGSWSGGGYNYGYNGMLKEGIGKDIYHTLNRALFTEVPVWMKTDPLEFQFPWRSPYLSMGNNPINMIDPNGDVEINGKNIEGVELAEMTEEPSHASSSNETKKVGNYEVVTHKLDNGNVSHYTAGRFDGSGNYKKEFVINPNKLNTFKENVDELENFSDLVYTVSVLHGYANELSPAVKAMLDNKPYESLFLTWKGVVTDPMNWITAGEIYSQTLPRVKFPNGKLHIGKQGKHIVGHNNFDKNGTKSILNTPPEVLMNDIRNRNYIKAVNINDVKAEYIFRYDVGLYYNHRTNSYIKTNTIILHSSKSDYHFVPNFPKK